MQHTPAPADAIPFHPLRRRALIALVLAVAAMHAAVLWLLVIATKPHGRIAGAAKRIAVQMVRAEPPAKVDPAPRKEAASPPPAIGRPPRSVRTRSIAAPEAPAATAAPPQAASDAPVPPLILHSESTRRALRDIGRERSFADRAGQDINGNSRSAFDSRLSSGVANAAHGDCRKGEFKGGGMGLLSLPALALAAANGECAR
jgi:type IV secretory pathway VirB10-like protein